ARVEARARRDQHVLLLQQLHRKLLVVEARQLLAIDADERVHRAARRDEVEETALRDAVDDRLAGFVETTARRAELANALEPAERRLHGPLARHVAAEPQRREQIERAHVTLRSIDCAAERDPAHAITARAIDLREPAEGRAERFLAERSERHEL